MEKQPNYQSHPLAQIICQIDKAEASDKYELHSDEIVIIFDKNKKCFLSRIPILSGNNIVYYLVYNNNNASSFAECRDLPIEVTDFARNRKLGISVDYRASCPFGKEEQVVRALCGDHSPGDELDKRIKRWVFQLTDERAAEFIDNYYHQVEWLQTELKTKAAEEIGLKLDVRLSLENSKQLEPIKIRPTEITIEVTDFAKDRKLPISVAYRATCPPEKEKQVAQALGGDNYSGDEFGKKIKRWVFELTNERAAEFIDNYYSQIEWLQTELKTKAADEIGLNLDVRLSLEKENDLKPLKIRPTEIKVYVKDYDYPLDLEVETELIVNDPVKATSNLDSDWWNSLVNLTTAEIKQYLLRNITISQFYYELEYTVKNGLVNHLNNILGHQGRRVKYLFINKTFSSCSPPQDFVEIKDFKIDCKVQKYRNLVSVENNLQMLLQDLRRYMSAKSPNVEDWVKLKLEKIIKPLLMDKNYADILCDFSQEAEAIRQAMQIEAESIGYYVKHILSVPKQEHSQLLDNLEIKDEKSEFSTNVASIKVKLSTAVNLKFTSLEKFDYYLNKKIDDIKNIIQKTINRTTAEILINIDPERFYMRFYKPKNGEKSVEQELKDEITKALEDQFGATLIRVVPIPEQTDIIEYLQRLIGMVGSFECKVPSLMGGEAVTFQGDFKILGIEQDSWYTFQLAFQSMRQSQQELLQECQALTQQYSKVIKSGDVEDNRDKFDKINHRIRVIENEIFGMDDIKKSIEKSVKAKLMTRNSQFLTYTDMKCVYDMERDINQWARNSVVEQYGLDINIINLSRRRTQQEEYFSEVKAKSERANADQILATFKARDNELKKQLAMFSRRNKAHYQELIKLYEQRLKLIAYPDFDQDDLKDFDNKITSLEKEIPSFLPEDELSSQE